MRHLPFLGPVFPPSKGGLLLNSQFQYRRGVSAEARRTELRHEPGGIWMPVQRCPRCGTPKVRLAPRRSLPDRLLQFLTIYPVRCQLCTRRFRTFLGRPAVNPRRNYERVRVKYPVWFKPTLSPAQRIGQEGVIDNLSIRGCRIRSSVSVAPGTRLSLEFQPSTRTFPITIDAAIVRSRSDHGFGLRFADLPRDEEQRIRRIIDLHLHDPAHQ